MKIRIWEEGDIEPYEREITDYSEEAVKELTKAFMMIRKVEHCYFTLKGESEIKTEGGERLGALFA